MQYPLKNMTGEEIGVIELADAVFALPMNHAVVHQAMLAQRANGRKGTAATKTRSEVSGGGKKPRPQKHSGRSRQGSIRAPQWKGGGVVFGPHPRSYRQHTPKKMRRLAIRCLLSEKASTGHLLVLDQLVLEAPSTKKLQEILNTLSTGPSVLIALEAMESSAHLSARNLQRVRVAPADLLNVLDLLNYDQLVMTQAAVQRVEDLWAQERSHRKIAVTA
ncbi:MAG: 50S ribosomal protein L4 [Dehalococcoidia bacterium]|nr:50S ribosomal protein L4 [Dehalococcoidia bacterium]